MSTPRFPGCRRASGKAQLLHEAYEAYGSERFTSAYECAA